MDRATLIKELRTCASNGTNCQKCPMFLVCVLRGNRLTQLAADMLEEDARSSPMRTIPSKPSCTSRSKPC